jgi:integrase
MAAIIKLPSGNWRVQVRRKHKYVSDTFRRHTDAEAWALEAERTIDRGLDPKPVNPKSVHTFADVINLHVQDLLEVGKSIGRSKRAVLESLKISIGSYRIEDLTRETLIEFGKKRAKAGAGPCTLAIDLSFIGTLLTHAAAVHGISVSTEQVKLARVALDRLGLVGKSQERDRRPTQVELDDLIGYFEAKPRQLIPLHRMIRFAVATAMRLEEICKITWDDVNAKTRIVVIRDRKDPRKKEGNHHRVPMLDLSGYDAWQVLLEQRIITRGLGRVFPHHHKSAGTAFHHACKELHIEDLHFHDLRHEATSRLFEAGLSIEKVALVTGHKDWKMLRRYTNLLPESLHPVDLKARFSGEQEIPDVLAGMVNFRDDLSTVIKLPESQSIIFPK